MYFRESENIAIEMSLNQGRLVHRQGQLSAVAVPARRGEGGGGGGGGTQETAVHTVTVLTQHCNIIFVLSLLSNFIILTTS